MILLLSALKAKDVVLLIVRPKQARCKNRKVGRDSSPPALNRLPAVAGRAGLFELVFAQEITPAIETVHNFCDFCKVFLLKSL